MKSLWPLHLAFCCSHAFVVLDSARTATSLDSSPVIVAEEEGVDASQDNAASALSALSMNVDTLAEKLGGRGRARLAWDCYSIGVEPQYFYGETIQLGQDDYETIVNELPTSRRTQTLGKDALEKLAEVNFGGTVEDGVATLSHVSRSSDDTTKLLLKLRDGWEVETVIIPWNGQRSTLCISSQVGCRQGCTFCATGKMGKLRSLTSDEILAQMFFARKVCRIEGLPEVTNIVFMGMGEPSDNVEAVTKAAQILTTRELFQLSATKVTISTVAPSPDAFLDLAEAPCVLAWSVHAAKDPLRKKLVPTTKYPMTELRQGLIDALNKRTNPALRTTMIEVAMMAGVNDSLQDADDLADFVRPILEQVPGSKLVVNLIPFNDIGHPHFQKPAKEVVVAFQQRLWRRGIFAHIRSTRGDDESAACGQLATKRRREQHQHQQGDEGPMP